ncbi:MAG: T9SS type A sorting domain-containing protein [Vicingaceae bacterium]|jgi:hypothetical protein|tara:strand:+ start:2065 stop:2208 length:144 start_codon:yes stop_codon:yes gene_type:complete
MTGNVILESGTLKTNTMMIVSFLSSGIYFVILGNSNDPFTKKIILID